MTQVVIDDIIPRTQLIAASGQTVFNTNWTADATTDIDVYRRADGQDADDATQLVSQSLYNVTFVGSSQTVRVTFLSGVVLDDIITIVRNTPAERTNLYINTNFVPSMLNQDFGILTLVDQQAQMYDTVVNPGYNVSATIDTKDKILPILGANQVWAMNSSNTLIIPYNVPAGGGIAPSDAKYLLQQADSELPNAQAMGALASGFVVNTVTTGVQLSRILTPVANQTAITNGSGIAGNPTIGIAPNAIFPGTEGIGIPVGTTAQRPVSPTVTDFRFNTDLNFLEYWDGSDWVQISETDGVTTATGTEFQVLVNGTFGIATEGAITLTTPQDIAPTSSPTFVDLTLTGAFIKDVDGNNMLGFSSTSSGVNYFVMQTQATGQGPILATAGLDADVPMTLFCKGGGNFNFQTTAFQPISIECGTGLQHTTIFQFADTAASRTVTFPDASGTVAFTTDIPSLGNFTFTANTMSVSNMNGSINIVPNGSGSIYGLQTGGLSGSSANVQFVKNGLSVSVLIGSFINSSTGPATAYFKSRGATVGSFATAVQNGDALGSQQYYGTDGTDSYLSAIVYAKVDGSVSTGIIPSRFEFATQNSSGSVITALTLNSSQVASFASNVLVPAGVITAGGNIQSTLGALVSGQSIGGLIGTLFLYPFTAGTGSLQMLSQDNAGAFINTLQNASTTAARTWTLPDATGTIALGSSTLPSLQGTANQVLVNGTSGTPITGIAITLTTPQNINTTSSPTFVNLTLGGTISGATALRTAAGLNIATLAAGASAVNYLTLTSVATGQAVVLGSAGSDTNVDMRYLPQAAGIHNFLSTNSSPFIFQTGTGYQHTTTFTFPNTAASRTFTFPDASGTIALTTGIPSLGNYSFSANTMTVASGNMLFTPPGGVLTLQNNLGGSDPSFNISSTSATGQPFLQWSRNTSTAIGYIQCGTNITGSGTGDNMLFLNPIVGGHYYFNIATVGNVLDLGPTTATFAGAITSPSIAFNTTSGIIGTTTNNNAAAGSVGEEGESNVPFASAVSLSSGAGTDITSMVLQPGDYDVWANISFNGNALTVVSYLIGWIGVAAATPPDQSLYATQNYAAAGLTLFNNGVSAGFCVPSRRITVANATTTTIYLSGQAGFTTSTATACGTLFWRRRR